MPHWNLKGRTMAAITAFRKPQLIYNVHKPLDWSDYDNRVNRYALLWAMYENTAYDNIHRWAQSYKTNYGLYASIRNLYNPSNYIGNFQQTYVWGGRLDTQAGDGKSIPSSLPIETENENIRSAIADMWKWSNWQRRKDIITLFGAVMGDVGVRIVDNADKGRVYFDIVHPANISFLEKDDFGHFRAYIIEEEVVDPFNPNKTVIYRETAEHGLGDEIVFRTFKDKHPFDWTFSDNEPEWVMDYGFVPFAHIQHIDIDANWGQAESHAAQSKIREIDEKASLLGDHIRKETAGLWYASGTRKPEVVPTVEKATPTADNPHPDRERMRMIYSGGTDGDVKSLVSDLNIESVVADIQELMKAIDKEYPERRIDEANELGTVTGRALKVLQEPASNKIILRRPGYDGALVQLHQMGLTIGAMGGYEAYTGISADGFANGDFEHSIGVREVFKQDKTSQLEDSKLFWEGIILAISAGATLEAALSKEGWTNSEINDMLKQQRRDDSIEIRGRARRAANEQIEAQEQDTEVIDVDVQGEPIEP